MTSCYPSCCDDQSAAARVGAAKGMMSPLEVKRPEAVTGAAIGHKTHGRPKQEGKQEKGEKQLVRMHEIRIQDS